MADPVKNKKSFGTAPVFLTAISTILGAILFLRFGFAVGSLGFLGVILIIIVGHMVTIPTAFAISEISTNQRVEGGGEYFIVSRSFGMNIGATIGISLFLSQTISIAFYVIAFTEAFSPFFNYVQETHGFNLPRQAISLPAMAILSILILKKGANLGVKALYVVVAILLVSLALFFIGKTGYAKASDFDFWENSMKNMDNFFVVFAICFPAFTGMTAGVGLSGDLKKPSRSIPLGTVSATFIGMFIYVFIAWKFYVSASPEDLIVTDQLVMSKIALWGWIVVPLGLAASTISSAIGSVMVAPRTLQALAGDRSFPSRRVNALLMKGKGETNEPYNASVITIIIAFFFVALGNVDAVAEVITMFFMITYGSLCLISFLYHFGADPSYRPVFRSKWYISLIGFVMSIVLMFQINTPYALAAMVIMFTVYLLISYYHSERRGIEAIFQGVMFQLNRKLHVYLQQTKKKENVDKWRPSAICVSQYSLDREQPLDLLSWISYKYGFGTYIHLIEGYYSKSTREESESVIAKLIKYSEHKNNNVFVDTIISPSYTSAIAQVIQLPGISGMENNMVIFDFNKENPDNLEQIIDNYSLVRAGNFDVCVIGCSSRKIKFRNGIHIWLKPTDFENITLMILLNYIILSHPDWKRAHIRIFNISKKEEMQKHREELVELIQGGRIPISLRNIEFIALDENINAKNLINEKSAEAALTVVGFRGEQLKHTGTEVFTGYDKVGNILFMNTNKQISLQ